MRHYSCEELGVCHCDGACAHSKAFAPGVIEAHAAPCPRRQRAAGLALRWGWRVFSAVCVGIVLLGLWGMARDARTAAQPPHPALCERPQA